jgi:hypothetical protein
MEKLKRDFEDQVRGEAEEDIIHIQHQLLLEER